MAYAEGSSDDWIGWLAIAGGLVCCLIVVAAIVIGIVLLVRQSSRKA